MIKILSIIGPCDPYVTDCNWSKLFLGQCMTLEDKVSFLLNQFFLFAMLVSAMGGLVCVFNSKYRKYLLIMIIVFVLALVCNYIVGLRVC